MKMFIKWLSIIFTVSLFVLMVASSVYQVINDHSAQIVFGILAGICVVVYLVINGINELIKLGLPETKKSEITYGPGMNKHIDDDGMVIKDGKLKSWKMGK